MIASIRVRNVPLSGNWDGKNWDPQTARCSNNFMSNTNPPVPPASAAGGLRWIVAGLDDPDSVVFDVSVDTPHGDPVLFTGVRNNTETPFLLPEDDGIPPIDRNHYRRGIYIANVDGAPRPFRVNVVGVGA
ncbi:MAG: hypothetical protein ACRDTH_03510 [Pseudonocardiaceae bacterium]